MTEIKYGSKFTHGLDTKEIAKMVRKDIQSAIKSGNLPEMKVSVKIRKRFSGGSSIDTKIKEATFPIANAKYYERIALGEDDTLAHMGSVSPLSDEARIAIKQIQQIIDQYNFDGSDMMTDYFNVNFYSHVTTEWTIEKKEGDYVKALVEAGYRNITLT